MNEFNIIKYLNDINLQDIISLFPVTTKIGCYGYTFEAIDQNKEFINGYVYIYSNKISIFYKTNDGLSHQFSSELIFYTQSDYDVITEYSTINSNKEKNIVDRKIGKNIPKRDLFSFKDSKKKQQKRLFYY